MFFYPIDILTIALLILFLYNSKVDKKESGTNEDYLSIRAGKALRGFFAIVVILHHLEQNTTVGLQVPPFRQMGFLAVSVFFFLSGYGLQKSHMKSERYRKKFLLRRLPRILLPYAVVSVMFWFLYAQEGQAYSLRDTLRSFVSKEPIVLYSWYIINILVFYAAYWLLMIVCKDRYFAMVIGAALWYGVYAAFCYKSGYPAYWYSSSHLPVLGMLWATYEDRIVRLIRKRYALLCAVCLTSFLALMVVEVYFAKAIMVRVKMATFLLTMTISVLFVLCVILYSMKVKFGNRVLTFLGDCSLEIYLVQGLFILGLRGNNIFIGNDLLWAVLTVAGSVALGFVLHLAFSKILRGYDKLFKLK